MKDPALLTGELRVPRTDSRALCLEAIERELGALRYELYRLSGYYMEAGRERDGLLQRRWELEEERRGLVGKGTEA